MHLPDSHPLLADDTQHSRLVQTLLGNRQPVAPVWFMRQAGRSLPEYRALRAGGDMLAACLDPETAAEITLQPVRRHGVDAAIFFSDIVIPLKLVGLAVDIVPGRGPVFAQPANTPEAIAEVVAIDPTTLREQAEPIQRAVARTTRMLAELSADRGEPIPLIGFAGAPFTLAAYLVEGGPSKDYMAARKLMQQHPESWTALVGWLAAVTGEFLAVQVEAGASAAQLFDSWAGALSPADYREHALWASDRALDAVRAIRPPAGVALDHVPTIHFGVGTGELLADMASIGTDALGVDYRVPLDEAVRRVSRPITVQGNLDPALFFAPAEVRQAAVDRVLSAGLAARAHVFNLGHGVPQDADPEVITDVVRMVHAWRAQ